MMVLTMVTVLSALLFFTTGYVIIANREMRQFLRGHSIGKLWWLGCPGYFLLEKTRYDFSSEYDSEMLLVLSKIYSKQRALPLYRVSTAKKWSVLWLCGTLFVLLYGFKLIPNTEASIAFWAVTIALIASEDIDARKTVRLRDREIVRGLPHFVIQLTLLVNAGLSISAAWVFAADQMDKDDAFTRELRQSAEELAAGHLETSVYEDFAERCNTTTVRKFITVLNQSVTKGSGELVHMTQLIASELWSDRKSMAIREAEKASTKILVPMGIILIGLLMVVITPLALQFMTLY